MHILSVSLSKGRYAMHSLWSQTAKKPYFDRLNGDVDTDVLIIGGGLTGILCAYQLHQAKIPYLLVEAKDIGGGITKNTTAKVTAQHGLIYHKFIQKHGIDAALRYYNANADAVQRYRQLCATLDCDFQVQDAFVYTTDDVAKITDEVGAYRRMGVPADLVTDLPLPFPVVGAVKLPNQGQIHPLQFLYRLSEPLHIKEHTKVIELASHRAKTHRGTIRFKQAIVATHFPILNKHGGFFLKMYQHRSYVLALENAPNVGGMYIDAGTNGLSCIESRIRQNSAIMIYPEAHIWPYYTKIRDFPYPSFEYACRLNKPIFVLTNCYQKRRFSKKPKILTFVDGPFYPNPDLSKKEAAKELREIAYHTMCHRAAEHSTYEYIRYIKEEE